ncbi:lipoprotein [Roseivivax marinus]|jgi:hypothetical protein|uniref:Lipoprotein n=1 Tax=Roseivivax marinus TaxID=1379903 RepID=W4HHB0_9RHOB|nr:DUF3035 domain-containing protein [Roseivivax marinus]ETW12094.1 lipoprotein [Roseivivax marinus]UMA64878.1 DUF3035 domain-containing protein [Roseivivax marinus]SEL27961.1 Beta-barrel assembly machine subunit BamF [Roseivivax marinus]
MSGLRIATLAMIATTLAACSGIRDGETNLRDVNDYRGTPEEFGIVPNRPLQMPQSFAQLPAPTEGANRADLTPLQDAVAALGGDPSRMAVTGIPAGDTALVAAAGRRGVAAGIRRELAVDDAAFRRRKSILNFKIVRDDEYNRAYRGQSLDAQGWLQRVRRPGTSIRTPSAPPPAR